MLGVYLVRYDLNTERDENSMLKEDYIGYLTYEYRYWYYQAKSSKKKFF